MQFTVDKADQLITVERTFAAPLPKVWAAWTESSLLDQWWAPKPYKAETKRMDFSVGGYWLYAMKGPEGDAQWCRADYTAITPEQHYSYVDAFCDENGHVADKFPNATWNNDFKENDGQTTVHIRISFDSLEDLEKIVEMGFQEGFTMGMNNLDELLGRQ
jgi:PhnB protein